LPIYIQSGLVGRIEAVRPAGCALPPAQLRLWPELSDTPDEFTLGTAIALRLGHPTSVDFDFFANNPFTPKTLFAKSPLPQRSRGAALGAEYADRDAAALCKCHFLAVSASVRSSRQGTPTDRGSRLRLSSTWQAAKSPSAPADKTTKAWRGSSHAIEAFAKRRCDAAEF
jgi:hypothetical protein